MKWALDEESEHLDLCPGFTISYQRDLKCIFYKCHFMHLYNENPIPAFLTSRIIVRIQEDNEWEDAL